MFKESADDTDYLQIFSFTVNTGKYAAYPTDDHFDLDSCTGGFADLVDDLKISE